LPCWNARARRCAVTINGVVMRLVLALLLALPLFGGERYIVEYHPSAFAPQLSEDAPRLRVKRQFSRALRGVAVELAAGQSIDEIARLPYVANVYVDAEVHILGFDAVACCELRVARALSPGRNSPGNAQLATSNSSNGTGIVVAVLDTGVDGTHPALAGKVIGGWDFVNDDGDPTDDHRHGTHVAGIIAAQSDVVTGVAPGVSILAFKVLDEEGRGLTSNIIAALERTIDPNGDGDLSDRADVANLSLGMRGRPDDPLARAVENAIAAGVVVSVAAGNDGNFHSIGSPAAAPAAITVGASWIDDENVLTVADFSSRGPSPQNASIKPDLVAPGVRILSTGLHGGYVELSGTSMAAPYVAGLAALLLEEHPDWTPARVKAALVTTSLPIDGHEVMTQGTGLPNAVRAAASSLVAHPTQLNFGLDGLTAPSFTSTRRVTLRNDGAVPRTIAATSSGASDAIALTVTPNEFTLAPGESREIEVTVAVDHAKLPAPPTRSLAFGGLLTLESNGDAVRVPWAFVRAGRATVSFDGTRPEVAWSTEGSKYASFAFLDEFAVEVLLEPATYDFFVAATKDDDARLIVKENVVIEGDTHFALTAADAPHEVRLDAAGDAGDKVRSTFIRLLLPRGGSLLLPAPHVTSIHSSSFSERVGLLATQAFTDPFANTVHLAQHPPLRGLSGDRTLTMPPSAYAAQEVRLRFPEGVTTREVTIMPRDWPRLLSGLGPMPPVATISAPESEWTGTLYMTPEVHDDYAGGVQLSTRTEHDQPFISNTITPVIRRNADGFFAARGFEPPPLPVGTVAGETMEFGIGPAYFLARFRAGSEGIYADAELSGARGELRRWLKAGTAYRVTDANGAEVVKGHMGHGLFYVPLSRSGKLRAELTVPGGGTLAASFDTTNGPAFVPSLTSLAVLDGAGRHVTQLPRNGNGSVVFSAAGHDESGYRRIVTDGTKVFFRRRGTLTWVQLTPVQTGEDTAVGVIYRVDLADALRVPAGEIELGIEIRDEQGSVMSWETPAFTITAERAPTGKRRSVR
jgi:hypothetical protein